MTAREEESVSAKSRVERLEERMGTRRCATCASRPTIYFSAQDEARNRIADLFGDLQEPPPELCPECQRPPDVVHVVTIRPHTPDAPEQPEQSQPEQPQAQPERPAPRRIVRRTWP